MKATNVGCAVLLPTVFLLGAAVFLGTNPQFLPSYLDPLQPYFDRVRSRLNPTQSACSDGAQCQTSGKNVLPDGRTPSPLWDAARHLMANKFSSVSDTIPGAEVNYAWEEPLVVYYDNILTEDEINMVIDKATPLFKKSMVVGPGGEAKEDNTRTSDTAWLYHTTDESIAAIVQKVTSLAGFSMHNAEGMAINRYQSGQFFNPHYDFLQEDQVYGMPEFKGCQRASTVLIYLSDVEEGGETVFARDGKMDGTFRFDKTNPNQLVVKPKRGRILIWYDMHPYTERVDHRTLHGGSPVTSGTKIAATIFVRNCSRQMQTDANDAKAEL